jgi:hypothetical protein
LIYILIPSTGQECLFSNSPFFDLSLKSSPIQLH